MSQVDDWPQAEILTILPPTARLHPTFDPVRLSTDVDRLRQATWVQPRIVSGDGVGDYVTKMDWRTLSLRSIGGSAERTDPGGPSLADFADTPLLAQAPYLSELLRAFPAPLCSVRLMALGPGACSPVHLDTRLGLPWGKVRLHVPIVTTPEAVLEIAGEIHCWQPGELWYADFTRMHVVRNTGTVTRIHLVIDCFPTKELLELFPAQFQAPEVLAETLVACDAPPLTQAEMDALSCAFNMPASFRSYEEPEGKFRTAQPTAPAAIRHHGGSLALFLEGEPALALVHVGNTEFRFAGWTTERTIQVTRQAGAMYVTLRSRAGTTAYEGSFPASPQR